MNCGWHFHGYHCLSHTLELFQNCSFCGTVQNIDSTSCEKLIHARKQKTQTIPELSASFKETPIHNLCCQLPRFHCPTKSGEKTQQQQPIIKTLISLITSAQMHSSVGRFPQPFMLYKLSLRQRFSIHESFVGMNNYAITHWCAMSIPDTRLVFVPCYSTAALQNLL